MQEKPLVSYVIGVRNMEGTVGKTIESILNQDYPNKEIIVINDGSDDNTEDILKRYPIKFINTEKIGISNARNLGYKNSEGFFIAFTDADCELIPEWTTNILKGFQDEEVGLIGGITKFRTDGSFSSIYRSLEFSKRYNNIESSDVVSAEGPGSMFRRKVLDEIGGFNPEWVHAEDAEISFLTIERNYKILKQHDAITYHMPENNFKRIVRKGLRDSKSYVRASTHHAKTSIRDKFRNTWYFRYDLILLPIMYAFLIVSFFSYPILYLLNNYLFLNSTLFFLISIWSLVNILIVSFLFIYGLIPSFQVFFKSKKLKNFLGTFLLHHTRGFAWGFGLIIGIKNLIIRKT